jgi:hypothetical protein
MNTAQLTIARVSASLKVILLGALISLAKPLEAPCFPIDSFSDQSDISSPSAIGVSNSSFKITPEALGGDRQLLVMKTSPGTGVARLETGDGILGYTQGNHAGIGVVTWDGDRNPGTLTTNGLGSIDMGQDGGDAFLIQLLSFDYPANREIYISLRLFDPSSAKKFSEVKVTVNQAWDSPAPLSISLPFSLFATAGTSTVPAPGGGTFATLTTHGSDGKSNLSAIGAVRLQFEGFAGDITIGLLMTNGRCSSIPNSLGRVVDACGVCFEDPAANKGKDACGTCLAGPPGYNYAGARTMDSCGLCPGQTGYQFPNGQKDVCGTCGGAQQDKTQCIQETQCTTVKATTEVQKFQKRLAEKAKALRSRFNDERKRAKRSKCQLSVTASKQLVDGAYQKIIQRGKDIFLSGVEVCGNSCITTSYAQEVENLLPEFKTLQKETLMLARKVKACYRERGIGQQGQGGIRGVSGTIGAVNTGLQDLINDCKEQRVCPPGAK